MAKRKQNVHDKNKSTLFSGSSLTLKEISPLTAAQEQFFENYHSGKSQVLLGSPGTGKTFLSLYKAFQEISNLRSGYRRIVVVRSAVPTRNMGFMPGPQPLSCNVLTPEGWTTMGELAVGDFVLGVDGQSTEVLEVYDFEEEDVYEVKTTTGKTTYATGSHLWETQDYNEYKHNKPGSVKTTSEIQKTLLYKNGKINHYLPKLSSCHFVSTEKALHPYALGVLLGDGSLSSSISFTSVDLPIVERMEEVLKPLNINITYPSNNSCILYTLKSNDGRANKPEGPNSVGRFTNPVKQELNRLGLMYKHFDTKFIPFSYIYEATVEDRMELLRGLLDTDGTVHRGRAEFFTSNIRLATDVQELVRSLGGSVHISSRDRTKEPARFIADRVTGELRAVRPTCESYCCMIILPQEVGNPFYVPRKAEKYKTLGSDGRQLGPTSDRILSIKYHSIEPVRCIKVASPRHLYVTDDYIVTHNTREEKSEVYELPYKQICNDLFGRGDAYEILKKHRDIEFTTTSYIRGITLSNTIVIVDEFQNLTMHEASSIITRIGAGSKIIFCGDTLQTDFTQNKDKDIGLFLKTLENIPNDVAFTHFGVKDIVRSGLVKKFILSQIELGIV